MKNANRRWWSEFWPGPKVERLWENSHWLDRVSPQLYRFNMAVAKAVMLTKGDYRLMPETGPRYQLIEGELFMAPAPNRYHQDISRNIEYILLKYLEQHPIGYLYDAPFDVYLNEYNVFQPDVVFIANARRNVLTDAGVEGAPNLVVEILSPRTAHLDKEPKRKIYASSGVEELWIVDPKAKTIAVYYLQRDAEQPASVWTARDRFASPCFPGLTITAADVFKE